MMLNLRLFCTDHKDFDLRLYFDSFTVRVHGMTFCADVFMSEVGDDEGLTRGPLVAAGSDMLSSVTLVSLTLSTDGCLWKNFFVLCGRHKLHQHR